MICLHLLENQHYLKMKNRLFLEIAKTLAVEFERIESGSF
jgi:hypothetical protein